MPFAAKVLWPVWAATRGEPAMECKMTKNSMKKSELPNPPAVMKKKCKAQKKLPVQEVTPETPSGNFWTMRIEPGAPAVLGQNIWAGTMVMKNYGPGAIVVDSGYGFGNPHVELLPGCVRVIATDNNVEVATIDNSALLEFEYLPKVRLK